MKFTIITATYNSSSTLKDTLVSVNSQTYPDIEHIIVDGVSKDNSLEIVKMYGSRVTKVISEPDNGIYDAMNKGIQAATGDIIGILNSDDFFTSPDVISIIAKQFLKDPTLDGVFTNLYYVKQDDPKIIVRHWISNAFEERSFLKGWHPPHPTLYLRKEVYEKYGLFNLDFDLAADFELMLRFFEKYKIKTKYIPETTIRMRLGGATSKSWKNIWRQNIQCINAFRKNGLNPSILYPVYRLLPKLFQYCNKR